jgi:hypothetical protein
MKKRYLLSQILVKLTLTLTLTKQDPTQHFSYFILFILDDIYHAHFEESNMLLS